MQPFHGIRHDMGRRHVTLGLWAALGLSALALFMARRAQATTNDTGVISSTVSSAITFMENIMGYWWDVANRPENAVYLDALHHAEDANGIPSNTLVALAYQESHFRPDIISGQTVSSAGAVGIMQIVPRWHPNVDPLDPIASINYAAGFLKNMYDRFGTWELALQAYNWGAGNLSQYLKGNIPAMPAETQNYSANILARVIETGTTIA